jgi:hypothetical protein
MLESIIQSEVEQPAVITKGESIGSWEGLCGYGGPSVNMNSSDVQLNREILQII